MSFATEDRLNSLLEFYEIDQNTLHEAAALWPFISQSLPKILNAFYVHLSRTPQLQECVEGKVENLKSVQSLHWKMLFTKPFSEEYMYSIAKIGKAHVKIGLSPDWYMGGYNFILSRISNSLRTKFRWSSLKLSRAISVIQKIILLDMAFAIEAYQSILMDEAEKRQRKETALKAFESRIAQLLSQTEQLGHKLETSSDSLKVTGTENLRYAKIASDSADEAAMNVQSGAASVEQMSVSVAEIGTQIQRSALTAKHVAQDAEKAHKTVLGLKSAAEEINAVTTLIRDIAEQTNLLALNATIEAARAGEAGKGFAVVATEVKELASQTGKATGEISSKIEAIQHETQHCVQEISSITDKIEDVSSTATSIAAAIEQQEAATNEISRSIQLASENAGTTTQRISEIVQYANDADQTIETSTGTANELIFQVKEVHNELSHFFDEMRKI
ncbi:globin-coupled sensor protein [Flexibacterium corallicola]|uniref:globin-coupled sensor protein n=1 Tax=Flexibacterium corallicola TaxID=3037259 RepID=UPI00286F9AC1|nr:globin-coupled sensor protein [Pseudovibrio sp. M1P-2-3]